MNLKHLLFTFLCFFALSLNASMRRLCFQKVANILLLEKELNKLEKRIPGHIESVLSLINDYRLDRFSNFHKAFKVPGKFDSQYPITIDLKRRIYYELIYFGFHRERLLDEMIDIKKNNLFYPILFLALKRDYRIFYDHNNLRIIMSRIKSLDQLSVEKYLERKAKDSFLFYLRDQVPFSSSEEGQRQQNASPRYNEKNPLILY